MQTLFFFNECFNINLCCLSLGHSLNPGAVILRRRLETFSCRRGGDCAIAPSEVEGENDALVYIMKLLTGQKKTSGNGVKMMRGVRCNPTALYRHYYSA